MKSGQAQKYTANVFYKGLAADVDPELLDPKLGSFLEAHCLHVSNRYKNIIRRINGDKVFVDFAALGDQVYVGAVWLNGYVVEGWRDVILSVTNIYANGLLIASHADLPGDSTHFWDVDFNSDTSELFITDNNVCPIILDLDDMLLNVSNSTYFADYDKSLYEVNRLVDLSQPVFQTLENMGAGGGLRAGSYSYAMRFSTASGEKTAWGPATPYIPVPYNTRVPNLITRAFSGILITGQESSLDPTKYSIRLRFRVNNTNGFDYLELKRYSSYSNSPINYAPNAEYIIFTLDANGATIDIKNNIVAVYDFVDNASVAWAVLDESVTESYSAIKRARTVRYFDRRVVLGGMEYESRLLLDKDIFIQHSGVAKVAFPIIEKLLSSGYSDMMTQVYKKAHRLGEKYGYAVKLFDNQGNTLYTVPLVKGSETFKNFQFPNRREIIPAAERVYSADAQTLSTVYSYDSEHVDKTDVVYEPFKQLNFQKLDGIADHRNVSTDSYSGVVYPYKPLTPTGRDVGYSGNGDDVTGLHYNWDDHSPQPAKYGTTKFTTGLSIGGIDPTKLPSWVKSFSIVRTPAAGRVVCQGIAMYALSFSAPSVGYPDSATKSKNKVWFYSPEFDINTGNQPHLFTDIQNNPSNYKMQLVSPVGFFTDVNSCLRGYNLDSKIDIISHAILGGNSIEGMSVPFDTTAQIGAGEGRATFGRFRNSFLSVYDQGSGVSDENLLFTISSAAEPVIARYQDVNNGSRTPYLELSLGSDIYAYDTVTGGQTSPSARKFHEPWYIVNIIQEGADIAENNINSYNDIGHFIKLESTLGISTGDSSQVFELVDERYEDVYTTAATASGYKYIWVDGQPWLGANNVGAPALNLYKTLLGGIGRFTPAGGLQCYGLYYYDYTLKSTGPAKEIHFPYTTVPGGIAICPGVDPITGAITPGAEIKVRYDNTAPIRLFLGDTVVDDVIFAPIDCNIAEYHSDIDAEIGGSRQLDVQKVGVYFGIPMPIDNFSLYPSYHIPNNYDTSLGYLHFVRQWVVLFGCESSVNLPFLYKDYYPNRNYVLRPPRYSDKLDTQSIAEYLDVENIYPAYDTDYPDEYLNWGYGGFHIPAGMNKDYQKALHTKGFTEPISGSNEITSLMKRLHWSTQRVEGFPSSRNFVATNVYDLKNDKALQISILYDVFSDKGGNLYVITDRGSGILLTNKNVLTDGVGNSLGMMAAESGFIQGEVWLNQSIGCPKEFWRGKSEGNVKLPNNVKVPVLIFPSYNDIVMLSANNFVEIADTNREELVTALKTIDLDRDFITKLYSVVDEAENNIWVVIGNKTYLFNIDINNWCAHVTDLTYVKSLYAPYLVGVNDRNVLAHIIGGENILAPTTTVAPTTAAPGTTVEYTPAPTTTAAPTTTLAPFNIIVDTPADDYVGSAFPGTFSVYGHGGSGGINIYWNITNSGFIIASGYENIVLTYGDNINKTFTGLVYPDAVGTNIYWVSLNGTSWYYSAEFEIYALPTTSPAPTTSGPYVSTTAAPTTTVGPPTDLSNLGVYVPGSGVEGDPFYGYWHVVNNANAGWYYFTYKIFDKNDVELMVDSMLAYLVPGYNDVGPTVGEFYPAADGVNTDECTFLVSKDSEVTWEEAGVFSIIALPTTTGI